MLVTGGTGLVGRAVVRALAASGHSVRVLSRRAGLSEDPLIARLQGDITSPADVRRAVQGCSGVFHCAAEKSAVARMHEVNVRGTQYLIEAARAAGVTFFCHLSSVGVFGRVERGTVDESTPCNPSNVYEQTKLAAEQVLAGGLSAGQLVILRPTNVFGAETVGSFLDASLPGRVRMFLKGRESAHLVYVKDVAAAALFFLREQRSERITSYFVSSDGEAGNTNGQVQAYLGSRCKPPAVAAPIIVPRLLRALRGRIANRGDIVFSSKRIREAGFEFPLLQSKALGLRDSEATPQAVGQLGDNWTPQHSEET